MSRVSALFLCLLLALSLGLGSVAHATEGAACVDATAAGALDHDVGDGDRVPADADRAYPHHHGNCHGHHVGVPIGADALVSIGGLRMTPTAWHDDPTAPAPTDPALRPPRA